MYVEVILPLSLPLLLRGAFTYLVPAEMEAQIVTGSLVEVGFGKGNRRCLGVVSAVKQTPPSDIGIEKIKPILAIESSSPVVRQIQLRFWQWISDYYLCTLGEVSKAALPASFLVKKGLVKQCEAAMETVCKLNALQQKIFDQVIESFQRKDVCLLHGAFACGKIDIYIHLIEETLKQNRQVLYLLPEIALTKQITSRLRQVFGNKLGVYHSRINRNEQIRVWNNLLNDEGYRVILGVRSSVFLPFKDLGLIIVDEEHDPSYKQQEPAPRYHARNVAIVLATMYQSKVVLGSATPSIESFYNTQIGKYGYVKDCEEVKLLCIIPVDVKELRRKKIMKNIFSPLLIEHMQQRLEKGEQILLFQNRRGFALNIVCKICDWTPKCHFCDVSLTYHKRYNQLTCHYCGRNYLLPEECSECGCSDLKLIGYGTEKVEEDIRMLFPDVSVDRMDLDTAKTKKSLERIVSDFEDGQTRILIGTQIIFNELNMAKVGLVGILNADSLMNFPDFRAYERAYQLILQIARGGTIQGEVILQTAHPNHLLIEMILQQNYRGMYDMQMEERALFKYPPLFRLVHVLLYHKKEELLCKLSNQYAGLLREKLEHGVVGPDKPVVGKIRNLYIQKILLKIKNTVAPSVLCNMLEEIYTKMYSNSDFRDVIIHYDVDPV